MDYEVLSEQEKAFIQHKTLQLHLSFQNIRKITEAAVDLHLWQEASITDLWDESGTEHLRGKTRSQAILKRFFTRIDKLRSTPSDYKKFIPPHIGTHRPVTIASQDPDNALMGTCPVASVKTRCCNLETLDAVKQCGYACSYCSIQSFYDQDRVYFHSDLKQRLSRLTFEGQKIYHIGTGQSSDSLMWGNQNNLLSDLFDFARTHENILLELKTKSSASAWMDEFEIPFNVIATWSLNPQRIIDAEELLTASLEKRLRTARTAADRGIPVGFHLHPIIYCEGWMHEYTALTERIQRLFRPEEVVMVSMGTLTFIKPVIKQMRERGRSTKTTEIPLSDAAGKLSYPFETKKEMFSHVYSSFSESWRKSVYYYLCMEDPDLWEPVFGYTYEDNEAFEEDMKHSYMKKVRQIRSRK
jgi:spore photoproduct lyase